jgi:DNA invertase Pin-like site-specific DNA recombinase
MKYGYAHCSTNETKQDIDRQIDMLLLQGAKLENIYFEYQSGTKYDRVQLRKLLDVINEGDTIITTEVSRITRSTKQLCEIIEIAIDKKALPDIRNF